MVTIGQKLLCSGKLIVIGQSDRIPESGCIQEKVVFIHAKVVVFGQELFSFRKKWLYLGKVVELGQNWLYSGKIVVFGQSSCIRAMRLYWGKVVVFGKMWLYSGKVVVFRQSGCTRAKWLHLGKSGCFRPKGVVLG